MPVISCFLGLTRPFDVHHEGVTREALARLAAFSKSTPSLLLTARRASILGLTDNPKGAVRISLSGGITAQTVHMMADPAGPQPQQQPPALSIAFIDPETKPGAAELGAIELAKLARLLPATVVATVPAERLGYLPAWAESESSSNSRISINIATPKPLRCSALARQRSR